MPTIFLSLPTVHNATNLVGSGMLDHLLAGAPLSVFALAPNDWDHRVLGEMSPCVTLEPLLPYRTTLLERVMDSLASEHFLTATRLSAVQLQRDRARLLRGKRLDSLPFVAKGWLSRMPVPRPAWYRMIIASNRQRPYRTIFERCAPNLLVTSTGGFLLDEVPLILEAKRQSVPQMAADLGWDNLSSKYHTLMPLDFLAVWNEQMRQEALNYHGYRPERVEVTGAPQFDRYVRDGVLSREAFLGCLNADPSRKLVTLAGPGVGTYPHLAAIARGLASAIASGHVAVPCQLLVRPHPRDDSDLYDELDALPHVIVERHGRNVPPSGGPASPGGLVSAPAHLAATLAHSDVLINFASTTTLEAFFFDTPVINIGFDFQDALPLPLSIRRYFHFEHYRPIVQANAVKIAGSLDELIAQVNAYLDRPWEDREARQAVLDRLCPYRDGRSAERVAHAIARVAEDASVRKARSSRP